MLTADCMTMFVKVLSRLYNSLLGMTVLRFVYKLWALNYRIANGLTRV